MSPQYIYFIIFAVLAYVIVTDNSVASAVVLITRMIKLQYEKTKWWLIHNPANPVVKYMIWRRSMKLAKELEKELNDRHQQ